MLKILIFDTSKSVLKIHGKKRLFVKSIFSSRAEYHPLRKNVYVVNPENSGEIHVYSNYQCETTDTFRKKLQVLQKKSQMATYRVSAETPVFEIEFENNPTYNNDFDGDGIQNQEDNCPL